MPAAGDVQEVKTKEISMKKLLSALLTVCLTVGLFAGTGLTPPAQAAEGVWGGNVATAYADGDGSADSPYQIATCAQLAYLAQQVNAGTGYSGVHFLLTSDIDLNSEPWTPIGFNPTHAFKGGFDGGGHAVSGLDATASHAGLFGYIDDGAVKNLSVSGDVNDDNKSGDAAMIAGFNRGTILNCYSTGSATGYKAGGIVGDNTGTIQNCYSTCEASRTGTTSTYVGGIAGFNRGTIQNCYWFSDDTAARAIGVGSGMDICGFNSAGTLESSVSYGNTLLAALNGWAAAQTTPSDYFSWGTVSGGYPTFAAVCSSAAVTPYADGDGSPGNPYLIKSAAQLYNLAQLVNLNNTAYNDKSYRLAANIDLGDLPWMPIGNAANRFKGSFDGGGHTVSGLNVNENCAGLFGYIDGGTVKNLSVSGAVSGSGTEYSTGGGVASYVYGGSTIKNCSSACTITEGEYCTGGVAGNVDGSTIQNCYNTGAVTGTVASTMTGGVAGYVHGSNSTIQNCYNTGAVTSTVTGGVAGSISGSSTIQNCYWLSGTAASALGAGTVTDVVSFNPDGTLSPAVSYGSALLAALNGWVNAQTTPSSYSSWIVVSGVNAEYPILRFYEATPCAAIDYQTEKLTGLISEGA